MKKAVCWGAGILAVLCVILGAVLLWARVWNAPEEIKSLSIKNDLSGARVELEDEALLADVREALRRLEPQDGEPAQPESVWLELSLRDGEGTIQHTLTVESTGRVWLDGRFCKSAEAPLDVHYLSELTERYGEYRLVEVEPQRVARIEVSNGTRGRSAAFRDEEIIRRLVENLGAVSWRKGEPAPVDMEGSYLGVSLIPKEGGGSVNFEIQSPTQAKYGDCYYYAVEGRVDTEEMEALVEQYEE